MSNTQCHVLYADVVFYNTCFFIPGPPSTFPPPSASTYILSAIPLSLLNHHCTIPSRPPSIIIAPTLRRHWLLSYLILCLYITDRHVLYSSLFNVKFIRNFKTLQQNSPWATKESIFHSIFLLYNQRMCILTIASFITIYSTYLHCLGNFIFHNNI